jgi:hypothetical protein
LSIITAMAIASVAITTTNIQTVSAQIRGTDRDLPQQAGCSPDFVCDSPAQNPTCGGGEEVRSAFPQFGTQTGPLTGQLNSGQPSGEAHQQLNQGWAATAGSCSGR